MNWKARLYFYPKTVLSILFRDGWKTAGRFVSDFRKLKRLIKSKLEAVNAEFRVHSPGIAYQKYLDLDYWLLESLRRFYHLGLHREKEQKRILDLGTGTGYFPFICNYYGHRAEAVDVPDNEMYNRVIGELGVKRYPQYIHAFKDLDLGSQYDIMTAFMICFNNHKTADVWGVREWDYFLRSVSTRNLQDEGRLFLLFNAESKAEPVDGDLIRYFARHQARIRGCEVWLQSREFRMTPLEHAAPAVQGQPG